MLGRKQGLVSIAWVTVHMHMQLSSQNLGNSFTLIYTVTRVKYRMFRHMLKGSGNSGALRTGSRIKKQNVTGLLLLLECTFVWNKNIFFGMPKEHKKTFLAPPMKYNVGVATLSQ